MTWCPKCKSHLARPGEECPVCQGIAGDVDQALRADVFATELPKRCQVCGTYHAWSHQ